MRRWPDPRSASPGLLLLLTAAASAAIGYTATMGVRLIFGRPDSLPSVTGVSDALAELALTARDVAAAPGQVWGVAASSVFVQRLLTSCLPPIRGWLSLMRLRRKELI